MNTKPKIQRILSVAVCLFISFLIVCSLFITAVACITDKTIASLSYSENILNRTGYAEKVKQEILSEYKSLGIPSGLPENYFDDKIDESVLKADILHYIQFCYNKSGSQVDAVSVENKLYDGFFAYAKTKMEVTGEVKEQLRYLAKICSQKYASGIQATIFPIFFSYLYKLQKILPYLHWGCILFTILLGVFLTTVLKPKRLLLNYLYYIFMSDGLLLLIVPLYCKFKKLPSNLGINADSLRALITGYMADINRLFFWAGIVITIMALLCLTLHLLHKNEQIL